MARLIAVVALALVALTQAAPAAAQQAEPIKIGVIQPLSGPVAASGNYIRMGAEIARDWINAKGGVLGRQVQLLVEDNKSDPKEAATAAEKLIVKDKVPVIVGAWGSSMTLAAMPKLEEYGVPMVVETSSAASITKRGNPWVFRISPPSEMEAIGLERYLKDLGIKKADFLAVNTDWGRGAVSAFGEIVKRSGSSVGATEFMEQAATDMNAQITKIKADGADTLFLTTSVEQITLVLKQAQEQRLGMKVITTGGSSSPSQLIKQAGPAAEGTYHILFFLPWFPEAMPDGKLAKAFVDEWAKRGHPFEGLTEGFRGHDGVATAAEAIKLAGKPEPKAVRDALWQVSITGVNGPIKFEKDGPAGKESGQSKPSIFIVQIKDGKIALPAFAARNSPLDQLLQHLLNGLLLGATYSLLGVGLTLVFGLMNVVNFAHGEFYTLGAYAVFAFLAGASVNFFLAIPLAVVVGAAAGALCERCLLRPLQGESIDTVMLVMIGVWIAMQNAELLGWGGVAKSVPTPFPTEPLALGPLSVSRLRVFVFAVSGLLILGAHLLLSRTKLGRGMRATFQDRETAALMGVSVERIDTVTFAFGSGLAAAAGALLGPVFLLYPSMGDLASLKAFSVVILGGLGSFGGAALGGLVLGVAEELGAGYVSSGYRDAAGFLIIVAVLLLRPSGLFARAERVG